MPDFQDSLLQGDTASDVMRTELTYLTTNSTFDDVVALLNDESHHFKHIPVVDSDETMTFLGVAARGDLRSLLRDFRVDISDKMTMLPRASAHSSRSASAREDDDNDGVAAVYDASSSRSSSAASSRRNSLLEAGEAPSASPSHAVDLPAAGGVGSVQGGDAEAAKPLTRAGRLQQRGRAHSMTSLPRPKLLRTSIPLLFSHQRHRTTAALCVDPGPLALSDTTPLYRVWFIFTMLGTTTLFFS